jgi:signal transduction histidine kinase/ligand-binding sensor domain-containing protein
MGRRRFSPARTTPLRLAATAVAVLGLASGSLGADGRARFGPRTRFGHLTSQDGLSSNWVQAILQDRQGYLWFGTQDGLNRYDGASFKVYRNDPADPHSLPTNVAGVLLEDRRGRLWVGSSWGNEGVSLYDRRLDRFDTFRPAPGSRVGNAVRALIEDRSGRIWLGTDNGVAELLPDTGSFRCFPLLRGARDGTGEAAILALFEDRRGRLWAGSQRGLLLFDREHGTYVRHPGRSDERYGLDRSEVWDFHEGADGRLWIATLGAGLHLFDPETGRDERFLPDPNDPWSISNARVRRIVPDGPERLFLGTENGGLDVLDLRTRRFEHYRPDVDDPASLDSSSIWSLARDDEGTLWIGTYSGGANFLSPYLQRFQLLEARHGLLDDSRVTSVLEDREGALWIGTDGGGLNHYDPVTRRFTSYRHDPRDPTSIGSDAVWAVRQDGAGRIWVGGWDGGLGLLDRASGRFRGFRHDPADPRTIANDHVWHIRELRTGELLVLTQGGPDLLDRATGVFTRLADRYPDAGRDVVLYSAAEDEAGNLWLVGNTFVGYVDRRSGKVSRYWNDPGDPQSLGAGWTQAVLVDSVGNVWFGTQRGLSCLTGKEKRWRRYTTADGLGDETVVGLLEDSKGGLWVSTLRGISWLADATSVPDRPRIHAFDVRDGLQSLEFLRNACVRGPSGTFYFGGARGLNSFRPEAIVPNPAPPRVVVTGLRIQGRLVRPRERGSPLEAAIGETERVSLSPSDTALTIEYAALNYAVPGKNRYRYKLEGFDTSWSEATAQHSATYTNLPWSRDFTFRVTASNNDGVWNEEGAALRLTVRPPFWATDGFRGTLALLLSAAAVLAYRRRVSRIHARARELAEKVAERTRELDLAYTELQRRTTDLERAQEELLKEERLATLGKITATVSHELRNPLSTIRGSLFVLSESLPPAAGRARRAFERIERNVRRCDAIVGEMLEFTRNRPAERVVVEIDPWLDAASGELSLPAGVELRRDFAANARARISAERLFSCLVNLVSNAADAITGAEAAPARGRSIEIGSRLVEGRIEIRVRDDGPGIPSELRPRLFEPLFSTKPFGVGLGLALVRRVMEQHEGGIEVDSRPGDTTFTLWLPEAPGTAPTPTPAGRGLEE